MTLAIDELVFQAGRFKNLEYDYDYLSSSLLSDMGISQPLICECLLFHYLLYCLKRLPALDGFILYSLFFITRLLYKIQHTYTI